MASENSLNSRWWLHLLKRASYRKYNTIMGEPLRLATFPWVIDSVYLCNCHSGNVSKAIDHIPLSILLWTLNILPSCFKCFNELVCFPPLFWWALWSSDTFIFTSLWVNVFVDSRCGFDRYHLIWMCLVLPWIWSLINTDLLPKLLGVNLSTICSSF